MKLSDAEISTFDKILKTKLGKKFGVINYRNFTHIFPSSEYEFGDGDHFVLYLEKGEHDYIIKDFSHTFSHIMIFIGEERVLELYRSASFNQIIEKYKISHDPEKEGLSLYTSEITFAEDVQKILNAIEDLVTLIY